MSAWTVLSVLSNIQVEKWCEDDNKQKYRLYLYLLFAISATLFSAGRAYILVMSGLKLGRTIHKKMIKSLLYASITKFYNRVPIGRILNRLSKDLREVDEAIGYAVGNTFVCGFNLISSLLMCIYGSTPYILIAILIVGFFCRQLLRYYLKSLR
jgi:ABC-type multidrug transport system fused ATPase/permease subunit